MTMEREKPSKIYEEEEEVENIALLSEIRMTFKSGDLRNIIVVFPFQNKKKRENENPV